METSPAETKEKEKGVLHYIERDDIRQAVKENWPELYPRLSEVTYPRESAHPDELERWEVQKRLERIAQLNEYDALNCLLMSLYEECFGVNSTPGTDETFHESLAPSPGGMISHGCPYHIVDGASIDMIERYDLNSDSAKEVVMSVTDYREKTRLATLIAETLYPLGRDQDPLSHMMNRNTHSALLNPKLTAKEETNTWALRLLKLVKGQSLNDNVTDEELREVLNISPGVEISMANYWSLLWREMSSKFLSEGNFKSPDDPGVKEAIGTLLKIRLNPATQVLFMYLSPSGYLNEVDSKTNL